MLALITDCTALYLKHQKHNFQKLEKNECKRTISNCILNNFYSL